MKKILYAAIAAGMMLIGANANAQLSVGAGYLNANQHYKTTVGSSTTKDNVKLNGAYVGASVNFELIKGLGVAPGLYYSFLTNKETQNFAGLANAEVTTNEHYVSVPTYLNYGYSFTPDFKVFAYAGPTFSVGLASNSNAKATVLGVSTEKKINNYDKDSKYGRIDVLVGGGVGVELFGKVRVDVGYDYGLLDRNANENTTLHTTQLHAGVAYLF